MKIFQACLVLGLLPVFVFSQSSVARQLLACLTSHNTILWSAAPLARTVGWVRDQARQRTAVSAWCPDLDRLRGYILPFFFFIMEFWLDLD